VAGPFLAAPSASAHREDREVIQFRDRLGDLPAACRALGVPVEFVHAYPKTAHHITSIIEKYVVENDGAEQITPQTYGTRFVDKSGEHRGRLPGTARQSRNRNS
jgi:hypothetical protein